MFFSICFPLIELRIILQPGLLILLHQDKIASTLEQFALSTITALFKKSLEQFRKQNSASGGARKDGQWVLD